ncbi:MAG: serine/threonine protein kinase [Deltaproteobacteria bacterium]|nr:serine/threonine protein kinase [Deltaproteobacteria bacterium]
MAPLPIDRIGSCRLVEEIASGGMAVVYKAVQENLNRTVAVKALKTAVAGDSQFAIRFEREALSLAQMQHENIIHVYDFLKERGAFFIVMEYVEGVDVYDLLERCGHLPVDVAAIVGVQVARALDYAHYRGIIHRDIKPANIMIARSGGVKLMDFGIARDPAFEDLTQAGTGVGTPSYMSPEQVLGDKLDFRSDLFALGIVMYQMVTGKKPFIEDEDRSVMQKIRLEKHPNPRKVNPDIPRELERILSRCLQKLPRDRWRSTQELVVALERFLAPRVKINYNARLVLFLKGQGLVRPEEAEKFLRPSMINGSSPSRPMVLEGTRAVTRRVAGLQGMITGAVALSVGLMHLAPVGTSFQGNSTMASLMPIKEPRGYLRVVANPWAHVFIDGKLVETTPIAEPIEVSAGIHELRLVNEYFLEQRHEILVPEGRKEKPTILRYTLERKP